MTVTVSIAPIATLLVALVVFRLKAWQAALAALLVSIAAVLFMFSEYLSPYRIPGVMADGFLFALSPICFIVVAALFTYAVTLESGAMNVIRSGLSSVSNDRRVLALLIVWGFGNFMEGMAGFGTAVAIPAALLVGLGFEPVKSVVMCLVANTTPTAFGSVGVPLVTLAEVSGVDQVSLTWITVVLQLLVTATGPLLILLSYGGIRALGGMWRMILLSQAAFLVPWVLSARFLGCELPDIAGGLGVMLAIVLSSRRRFSSEALMRQLYAWAPFGFVVAVLSVNALMPAEVKNWTTPGALVLTAAFIGGKVQKIPLKRLAVLFFRTAVNYRAALATICCVLMLARIMAEAGMISAIADFLVAATGSAYPAVSTLVGTLGGFVTGSGTSSCVLFGRLQADVARELCIEPRIFAAANVMGAGIGKMICPQSIAIGAAAASLAKSEGVILRKAFVWCLVNVVLATVSVLVFTFR
jgi:lactate permease